MDRSWVTAIVSRARKLASAARLGRFMTTGGIGLVVDMAVLALLVELGGLAPVIAKLASAEAAILVMFLVNERWTFRAFASGGPRALGRRFVNSHAVRVLGVAVATATLFLLHDVGGLNYLLANAAGIGLAFTSNYVLESLTTWRVASQPG